MSSNKFYLVSFQLVGIGISSAIFERSDWPSMDDVWRTIDEAHGDLPYAVMLSSDEVREKDVEFYRHKVVHQYGGTLFKVAGVYRADGRKEDIKIDFSQRKRVGNGKQEKRKLKKAAEES